MHTFNEGFYYRDGPERLYMDKFETDFETNRAIAYMEEHKDTKNPFFLMVAPHPPHPPFDKDNCPDGYWEQIQEPFHWNPNVSDAYRRENVHQMHGYYALIKNLDDNIGRLMDYLENSGLAENTIVVFTSDHGELMGSHGFKGKTRAYSEAANIPVIMRWPGHIPEGMRTGFLHSSIDHLSTLCSMTGIEVPEAVDGLDVSGLWSSQAVPEREAVLIANYSAGSRVGRFITDFKEKTTSDPGEWRAVKTGRYTYIRYVDGREELYDNLNDVYQLNNLAEVDQINPDIKISLNDQLGKLLAESDDSLYPGDYYADWYNKDRTILVKTALGNIHTEN